MSVGQASSSATNVNGMFPSLGVGVFALVTLCLVVIVSIWLRLVNTIVQDAYLVNSSLLPPYTVLIESG